jgi:UDP-glucose 4-epimerase
MIKKNKKLNIVVWGGSGFIGSHVCDYFSNRGYKVVVADKIKSQWLKKNQIMFIGNINKFDHVQKSIKGADYVFNFAGVSNIENSNKNPIDTINQNLLGNLNILEASKINKIKKYIFASTIYVYSNAGGFYKCSKQASEIFVKQYQREYGLNYNILRFGTVYGTRANEKNAVYKYIKNNLDNKKTVINGEPSLLREYIHVKDVANICEKIFDKKFNNQTFIVTGNNQTRISDLIEMISEISGKKNKVTFNKKAKNLHYQITPYSFEENVSKKIVSNIYTDLGQGILEIMQSLKSKK